MTDNLPAPFDDRPLQPRQAETDAQMIALWLHGRSHHTQTAYLADASEFSGFTGKPLHQVVLGDIQAFGDSLDGMATASQHRKLAAVKSLLSFAHRIGYLPFDVGKPIRLPAVRETLAERILSEAEVQRMLALEAQPRNKAILYLLYSAGLRVSELCSAKWRDLAPREDAGQISVFGKGDKTRAILLPISVWNMIFSLRGAAADDQPVFRSRKGGHLDPSQVWRIVRKASIRSGLEKKVSCHWLRHCHGSHSLDRGAPISLVQQTLGHASVATTGRYLHARPSDSSSRFLAI
jgi:integrase/recombinase XerD